MVSTIPGFCLWQISHAEAQCYIHKVLSVFGKADYLFPALLLDSHDFARGRVVASWPCEATEYDMLNFGYGGRKAEDDAFFPAYVCEYLETDPSHICIVDEVNLRPQGVHKEAPVAYFLGEQVYFLVRATDLPRIDFPRLLLESGYVFHAVYTMTSLPADEQLPADRQMSTALLTILARRATRVGIGAYDGRGVLIWEKTPSDLVPDRIVSGD